MSARRLTMWHANETEAAELSPLARQRREALAPKPDDPELIAVRRLVADLRPDCVDPMAPPPPPDTAPSLARAPSGSAPWDRLPAGLGGNTAAMLASLEGSGRTAADVLARFATLRPEAAQVLRWLRDKAVLTEGLTGLYVDCGVRFAAWAGEGVVERWASDLGARRVGARAHGRALFLRADEAWWGKKR